jgi:signal transduction histidine kinase
MSLGRRKLKNLLIFPESQVRYGLVFLTLATFVHVSMTIIVLKIYSAWSTSEGELQGNVPVWILVVTLFVLYFAIQSFAFALGLFMSHKVFGPLVPIRKLVEDLKNGNPGELVHLRKTDEPILLDLAHDLNQLAEKLADRS